MWVSDRVVSRLRDVASWPELPEGRYRIVRPIGAGGMGRVYVARDERLDRDVAIKVSNAPDAGSELDQRLEREARVLADLEHPGIVPVHDVGVLDDGRLFYVMKLVDGHTLDAQSATLSSESDALAIFERIAEPLAFAHARGIVHRDVKPSNVMVGPFGEVLVLDWGVAKTLGVGDSKTPGQRDVSAAADSAPVSRPPAVNSHTADGTRMGTPGFMAPEQAQGRVADISAATDVYALGRLLHWMLEQAEARPSKRLRAIVTKCLNDAASARYADAGHLLKDIARYRAGLAVEASPETLWDRFVRWFVKYRTFILLIAAYLAMRAALAWSRQ